MINRDGLVIELNKKTDSILITIEGNSTYYMSINTNSIDKLLVFSSAYFDNHWRKTDSLIQKSLANFQERKKDYKYQYAEEGFSHGITNPVPVVNINIKIKNGLMIPTLEDGLTRTNYLLANKAKWLVFNYSNQDVRIDVLNSKDYFIVEKEEI